MSYPAYTPPNYYDNDEKIQVKKEYMEDDCCSCNENSMFAKWDNWLAVGVGTGALTMMVSTFLPLWRYDSHGTTELEKYWDLSALAGFDGRGYGLIHVKGSWSQSWTTLAQASCDIRNIGQISNMAGAAWSFVTNGGDCSDSQGGTCCSDNELCQGEFAQAMHTRCVEYESMMRVSMVALFANFIACLMIAAGCTVFGLSKRKRTGGVAFGLWLFAGTLSGIMSAVWAVVTDSSFKALSQVSWYPYPSLHVGWYMNMGGYSLVIVNTIIFGFLVLPQVWKFDPAQEKLDKLQRKMDRKKAKDERHQKKKDELQRFIAAGGQPQGYGGYPPQPGYAPQPAPYGQVAPAGGYMGAMQQQQMQQQQLKGGYGNVQAQGAPLVVPGQQGYGAPPAQMPQGGYGAPPVQQTGFGLGPAQGGSVGSAQTGYGSGGQPNVSAMPPGVGGPGYGGGQPNLSSLPPPQQVGNQGGTGGTGGFGPSYGGGQPNLSSLPPGTGGTGPSYGGGQPNLSSLPPGAPGQNAAKRPPGPGTAGYNWPAFQGQPGTDDGETWNKMPAPPPSQQSQ
jgi:hypothetical protein